tara:strand:- start:127 stop:474 length:348 start_codon:yes stop_codon:yes gene_type:complete
MKKLLFLFTTLLFTSCSPIVNQQLFSDDIVPKQTVKLKYGEPTEILISGGVETWIYNNKKSLKSDRIIVFDNNGKIIKHQKELKDLTWLFRNTFIYGVGGIIGGFYLLAFAFSGF